MEISTIAGELYEENTYIISENGDCFIIDPGANVSSNIERRGLNVLGILLTHAHVDHMLYVGKLSKIFGAPVYLHESDGALYEDDRLCLFADAGIERGEKIKCVYLNKEPLMLGKTKIEFIHTPGHTAGSVCYIASDALFSGDTLMKNSVGRCDLPGGDMKEMQKTCAKLSETEKDYIVYPGHGPMTTLRREKEYNMYLRSAV